MRRLVFLCSFMFICLITNGIALGQTEARKECPFNITGTWKAEATPTNPIFFRFAPDGTVTLLSHSTEVPNTDFEVMAEARYQLDKPAAPKRLEIIAARGNEVFSRGTTALEIVEYHDESFTTVHPVSGLTRWIRAQTNRYFLTFAASSGTIQEGGPAFAMWTKLDGRQTKIDTLGLYLSKGQAGRFVPTVGTIPAALYQEFVNESSKPSDVMIRLELTEAEFERTHKVFEIWDKRVRTKTLLYDDPYLNGMEFLRRAAESLNQCREKVELHKLTWSIHDQIVTKHNLPQHPLEYIRVMRKKNNHLHVTDAMFPKDWRPIQQSMRRRSQYER